MTIAEVSRRYELTADTLRYYERIGLIPPVGRNKSGIRDYNEDDLGWIEFIKCMRSAGISIEALIEYVTMFKEGRTTIQARKALLIEQRKQLAERIEKMQETLNHLDTKIDGYEERMVAREEELLKKSKE